MKDVMVSNLRVLTNSLNVAVSTPGLLTEKGRAVDVAIKKARDKGFKSVNVAPSEGATLTEKVEWKSRYYRWGSTVPNGKIFGFKSVNVGGQEPTKALEDYGWGSKTHRHK